MNNLHQFEGSSSIQSCDYDDEKKILTVTFVRGKSYQYADVPKPVYEDLKDAESPGKYFQAYIRNVFALTEES